MALADRDSSVRMATLRTRTRDGVSLALHWLRSAAAREARGWPILLVHGTCSNRRSMLGPAAFFAQRGFDCFILETRGHGESERAPRGSDFDHLAEHDLRAGIDAVLHESEREQLFLVGHSGGGLAALMHLARHPERARRVRGVVTLASQATAAGRGAGRGFLVAGAAATRLCGYFPGRFARIGPEDELAGVMNQWFRWNWTRRWVARDGFDYLEGLGRVDVPLLSFAAPRDARIAPTEGCRRVFDAFGGRDKRFTVCARAEGFGRDFGHADLVTARRARHELWPRIAEWLLARSTATELAGETREARGAA